MAGTGGATSRTLTQTFETQSVPHIQIKIASDYTRFPLHPFAEYRCMSEIMGFAKKKVQIENTVSMQDPLCRMPSLTIMCLLCVFVCYRLFYRYYTLYIHVCIYIYICVYIYIYIYVCAFSVHGNHFSRARVFGAKATHPFSAEV